MVFHSRELKSNWLPNVFRSIGTAPQDVGGTKHIGIDSSGDDSRPDSRGSTKHIGRLAEAAAAESGEDSSRGGSLAASLSESNVLSPESSPRQVEDDSDASPRPQPRSPPALRPGGGSIPVHQQDMAASIARLSASIHAGLSRDS